jgi:phosphatidylserine decarboxylase
VNKALKRVLNEWGEFLKSGESVGVLGSHKTGWFGETGMGELMQVANAPRGTGLKFEEMYVCDVGREYYGYKSWDGRFVMLFVEWLLMVDG